jgi:hypothetical protein
MWVADDGTVLKQTTRLFGSELTFLRASPERAEQILAECEAVTKRWDDYRRARSRRSPPPPNSSGKHSPESGAPATEKRGDRGQ